MVSLEAGEVGVGQLRVLHYVKAVDSQKLLPKFTHLVSF